uniref:Uncharacterized protein n=1 Tax=Trichuris muris TaxID=70415 RepID=A0A5S6QY78_TRIMR
MRAIRRQKFYPKELERLKNTVSQDSDVQPDVRVCRAASEPMDVEEEKRPETEGRPQFRKFPEDTVEWCDYGFKYSALMPRWRVEVAVKDNQFVRLLESIDMFRVNGRTKKSLSRIIGGSPGQIPVHRKCTASGLKFAFPCLTEGLLIYFPMQMARHTIIITVPVSRSVDVCRLVWLNMTNPLRVFLSMQVVVFLAEGNVGVPPEKSVEWYYYGYEDIAAVPKWMMQVAVDHKVPYNLIHAMQGEEKDWSPYGYMGTHTLSPMTPRATTTSPPTTTEEITVRPRVAASDSPLDVARWKEEAGEQPDKSNVVVYVSAVVITVVAVIIVFIVYMAVLRKRGKLNVESERRKDGMSSSPAMFFSSVANGKRAERNKSDA